MKRVKRKRNNKEKKRGETFKHIRWKGGERTKTKEIEEREMKRENEDEVMEEKGGKQRKSRGF